ncbi:glutathione S-transferase family protein [uncultured Roseobacter sp.]|uniref:glutathione S-transferase family protein n=1 Tax=uncultured Roseobacter sp. TaxID=114847 RepID=UPI00261E395F|nr:glutathione S-transferase family protein [uncultured Roseobacter sp.]
MLEIWGRRTSSNVQALMWCVSELKLEFVRHDAGHVYGLTDTQAFGELNPNRTVPVLRDDDGPAIWETSAILRYLAGRFAPNEFWPDDAGERAQVDKWAEWAKINVAMAFTGPIFWRVVRIPEADRNPTAIAEALDDLHDKFAIAERQIAITGWLAGSHFTLADIQFGHILYRYFNIEINRPDWPILQRYFDQLMERDQYREHVAISYDKLRGSL